MAALVLSIAGAAAGSAVLGPVGAIVGRLVGAVAGNVIDQALFGARRNVSLEGLRLSDLTIMASTKGAAIVNADRPVHPAFSSMCHATILDHYYTDQIFRRNNGI
jgi:phage tail tape-measure protein